MGELVSIVYKPKGADAKEGSYTRLPIQEARLVVGQGIEGDIKGNNPTRQLNIMAAGSVQELEIKGFTASPGSLGEQLTVAGI